MTASTREGARDRPELGRGGEKETSPSRLAKEQV